jgi:hypothetical protein
MKALSRVRGLYFTPASLVAGNARSILTAERIALNFMQRMSGIATATQVSVFRAIVSVFISPTVLRQLRVFPELSPRCILSMTRERDHSAWVHSMGFLHLPELKGSY